MKAEEKTGKKVLIIDDEESISLSLLFHFQDCGYEAAAVDSAEAGLQEMERNTPEAVIVDLRLPGMNGIDFIRTATAKFPGVKYVIFTGSPENSVPDDMPGTGPVSDRIFYKPLENLTELSDHVKQLIQTG